MANPTKSAVGHAAPAATTATVGAAEHSHGGGAFPPFEKSTFGPQLIWLALTFGFLYWMLSKRLLPRVTQVIEGRAEGIRADLAEADQFKTETETSLKAYEQALSSARADAAGLAKSQRDALAADSDRERTAVDAQMAAKVADAEKQIAASKATALSVVSDVASQTVGAIVAKLTGQNVTGAEVAAAIAAVKSK